MTVIDTSAFMKFFLHENGWEEVLPHLTTSSSPETVDLLVTKFSKRPREICPCRADLKKIRFMNGIHPIELLFTKGPLILKPASLFISIAISLDTPVYDALFIAKAHCHTGYCGSSPGFFCAKKYGVTAILV